MQFPTWLLKQLHFRPIANTKLLQQPLLSTTTTGNTYQAYANKWVLHNFNILVILLNYYSAICCQTVLSWSKECFHSNLIFSFILLVFHLRSSRKWGQCFKDRIILIAMLAIKFAEKWSSVLRSEKYTKCILT